MKTTTILTRETAQDAPEHVRKAFSETQYRSAAIVRETAQDEARTVDLAFSSEEPYMRWWGNEILDHSPKSVRLGRLKDRGAVLMDHNTRDQVGVVERASIDADRVGRATVRLGKSQRATEVWQDIVDGIRGNVSVGYNIREMVLESEKDDVATYRVTDWEPLEVSIVAIPADPTVGIGRGADPRETALKPETTKGKTMTTEVETKPAAPHIETVDVKQVAAKAASDERTRVSEINAVAARFPDMREAADKAIADGTDAKTFYKDAFAKLPKGGAIQVNDKPEIGLTEKESREYRVTRLLEHLASPEDRSKREAAAFEIECSAAAQAVRSTDRVGKGAMATIPADVLRRPVAGQRALAEHLIRMMQRDNLVGTTTAGGHTVATDLLAGSFIDLLINRLALAGMGITTMRDLVGNVAIPRATGDPSVGWVGENSAGSESQPAFDQVTMSPKSITGFTDISRRLTIQSSIDVETYVRTRLVTRVALGLDAAGVNGSGSSNQPLGVLNTSVFGTVAGGTNGLAPTWEHIVDLETAIAVANADAGALAYLTNAKVRGKLLKTQRFSSTNGDAVWADNNTMRGYRAMVSNQVPSNLTKGTSSGVCSAIAFGNWSSLIMGLWGGLDILVDPYTGSSAGTLRTVVFQDADFTVDQPSAFAVMLDALTA